MSDVRNVARINRPAAAPYYEVDEEPSMTTNNKILGIEDDEK